ncbi:thada/death receptor interacting protein [Holotrichia oblita]|uniref:Thada/death receptor interacting protein n=1 Tax=Holotrichia oblita TaxID=644536 RepID=A0ACB9SRR7_HOLOL|nr:thada/death receptor interacting protein [Holotrichia oblita]
MKLRKSGFNAIQNVPIKIPDKFYTKNGIIQDTIEKLRIECSINEQQRLIKMLPQHSVNSVDSEFSTSLLTYLFLTVDTKHPIRKTISRVLLSANNDLVRKTLSENILFLINTDKEEKDCSLMNHYEIITDIQNCFNNFPLGIESISDITDYVTPYVIKLFLSLGDKLSNSNENQTEVINVHSFIYNITKLLVSLLQQCTLSTLLVNYSVELMLASYKIIMDDYISFDIKCNCGVLLVIAVIHVPDQAMTEFKSKTCLNLLKLDKSNDNQGLFHFKDITENYTANLCVYSGILNVVPENILCEELIDGIPVISFMFGRLIDCAKRSTGKPSQMLEVSRALILISKIMNTIPLSYVDLMFSEGLDYVWTHLDHFVDTVKHSTKLIFENLIKLAYRHYRNGCTHLLKMILTNTIDLLVNRSTHYVVLSIISVETGCSFLLEQFSHLPFILLNNIEDLSVAPQICNTYEFLMAQHAKEETDVKKWLQLWVDLVKPLLVKSEPPVTTYYQRLLISAYKIQPMVLTSIIHYRHHNGENELAALLGCLKVARKLGLLISPQDNSENNVLMTNKNCWRGYIEFEFLETIMYHQSEEVRVSALALIVESQKSTEIFSTWELDFLKKYFHYNANTQVPSTRQQIVALYKRALLRIKEGMGVLIKQSTAIRNKVKTGADTAKEEVLKELQLYKKQEINYKVFIQSFFQDYLCPGVHYGFNYYRRSTCLELILFVLNERCIDSADIESTWKSENTMALLEVLSDSYESNVAMAFDILKHLPSNVFKFLQSKECARTNILNAINLASAIKPSSATTAGYMLPIFLMSPHAREVILDIMEYSVNFSSIYALAISLFIHLIEAGVKLARQNLLEAVRTSPVYGYILCVRHLIHKGNISESDQWKCLLSKLVSTCKSVSEIVSPIVNNSSPEGYMPVKEGFVDEDSREIVTSQMVLVYAWRTTKEVSLLLGELALEVSDEDYRLDKTVLCNYIMPIISEHFLKLFLETKHRGAYEQAYLGFCKFCEKLWSVSNEDLKSLPKFWLTGILDVLKGENKNSFHKLCPTRRSAGLPFMIQAILITEPKNLGNENFHLCMQNLLNIAADISEENVKSRIHSMNILRSLYRNNNLGEIVAQYIAQGVIIAVSAFNHDKWGIRNSATLLFATLITRMFGVQRSRDVEELSLRNRLPARVFFMRYPELSEFLLEQISKANDNNEYIAALYSILLILERLYPCNTEEENQLDKYTLHITKCLKNCIYGIRRLAAQSSRSLIPSLELVTYIRKILIILSDVTHTDNYCQGLIMQLICLLRCVMRGHSPLNIPDLIEPTFWIPISVGKYISHYTAALYFDMLVSLTTVFAKQCQGALVFGKLLKILAWQSTTDTGVEEVLSTAKKKYKVCHFNLQMHIVSNVYHRDSYFKCVYIRKMIVSGLYSSHQEINQYCLNIINYLYLYHPKYMKHSLYITEQLERSEPEYNLVKSFDMIVKEYLMEAIHLKKLFPILYELLDKSKECCLGVLLILQHYPCILNDIKLYKQDALDFLMKWCYNEDDELFSAAVSAISAFLNNLSDDDIRQVNGNALVKAIIEASSPTSTLYQRIGAAQFFVVNKRILCLNDSFVNGPIVCQIHRFCLHNLMSCV